jgi:Flp pilus assembly protein TadG
MITNLRSLLGLFGRLRRDRKGATAVEFALLALPFFALSGAILEVGLAFFAGQTLETAVERASRLIRTGQAQQSNFNANNFKTTICNDVSTFLDCSKLQIDVRTAATFDSIDLSSPLKNGQIDTSKFGFKPGGAGEIVVVRAFYEWPSFFNLLGFSLSETKSGAHLLSATDAFKNEPFPW